jgi:hypothetical protein
MTPEALNMVVAILTTFTLSVGLLGLGCRYILLPWLKAQLVTPVQETHHQVTVNAHKSNPPTLRDGLDTLNGRVSRVEHRLEIIEGKVG